VTHGAVSSARPGTFVTVSAMTAALDVPTMSSPFPSYHVPRRAARQVGPNVDGDLVRSEAIEQVMRVSGDEDLLLTLLAATPGTRAGAAAAGRAMASVPVRLSLSEGCPILVYATGTALNIGWRRWCPPASDSLYSELLLYRSLTVTDEDTPQAEYCDAYEELEQARLVFGG
jgi:hypothetical protein